MWHESDPVDQEELERNQMVFEIQGNRNPFIDQPNLVSQISDF
jgi:endonuclease I